MLSQIERIGALLQGKGYGSRSLKREASIAVRLLGRMPATFVDIGGNKGDYTQQLLNVSPNSVVHIFEPSSKNLQLLTGRFAANPNISIVGCALGKMLSAATLYSDTPGSGLASLSKRRLDHFNIEMNIEESIEVRPFYDYWVETLHSSKVDFVKIDVEGYELEVLEGFGNAIHHVDMIQFEFGGCNIDTRTYFQDFWYFFKNTGFAIFRIGPLGLKAITAYSEWDERFTTTNYLALKR